jgi:ubiquinone/menaquinone biosynthesis C-methylase UbiE
VSLNDDYYQLENVPTFEAIHGEGLISLGGYDAVEEMFSGLELRHQELLDIGSGIGGIGYYLAREHGARVWGLEVREWMAVYARQSTPDELIGSVEFLTYDDNGNIPLPTSSIDLAYSKGVLAYIEDKGSLFTEIARVLRRDGLICMIDWLAPPELGKASERLPQGETLHKETVRSYEEMLMACGFSDVEFHDLNESYLTYVQALVARMEDPVHLARYGDVLSDDFREGIVDSYTKTAQAIESREQISYRIRAKYTQTGYPDSSGLCASVKVDNV